MPSCDHLPSNSSDLTERTPRVSCEQVRHRRVSGHFTDAPVSKVHSDGNWIVPKGSVALFDIPVNRVDVASSDLDDSAVQALTEHGSSRANSLTIYLLPVSSDTRYVCGNCAFGLFDRASDDTSGHFHRRFSE